MTLDVRHGDMRAVLPQLAAEGVRFHAVVTDPPYHLTSGNAAVDWSAFGPSGNKRPNIGPTNANGRGFMGKQWDGGDVAFQPATWRAVYDVLLPGGHMLVFGGTRTQHRMVCAIEAAGFEIRDTLCWLYGTGFPKSHDVSKGIDKAAGAERAVTGSPRGTDRAVYAGKGALRCDICGNSRNGTSCTCELPSPATPEAAQWSGWGTALKPAWEPIILARKPLIGTVAENVLRYGCGGLNVDACRVPIDAVERNIIDHRSGAGFGTIQCEFAGREDGVFKSHALGRWPANLLHDGSDEVEAAFAAFGERNSAPHGPGIVSKGPLGFKMTGGHPGFTDTGSASRFFYSAKADRADRADSRHPTVKPVDLMRWLCQLITPPGGRILDPFAGSGTTGEAAMLLGMDCTMIDADAQHVADIEHRIRRWSGLDAPLFATAEAAD